MNEPRIGLVPLARVHFNMELAQQLALSFRSQLILRGLKVAGSGALVTDLAGVENAIRELATQDFDLLVAFQATFADSTLVVSLAEAIHRPLFLWAVPEERSGGRLELNSLCGVNLAAHALTLRKKAYEYAYAPPDDPAAIGRLRAVAAAARVARQLKSARIGLLGERPAGMDSCDFDQENVFSRLGVEVVPLELQAVFAQVRQAEPEAVSEVRRRLDAKVRLLDQVEQAPLHRSLATYQVLRGMARAEKLDGLAVRCWPEFFTELQCAVCGALSLLGDEKIACGCEADVNGTLTQLVLQWLSGGPAFGADIVSADAVSDTVVLWHCGQAPISMCDPQEPPRATVHANRRLPLLVEFPLKPGRVTLARFSRASGELRLVLGRGEVLSAPRSYSGTSGVVRFESPALQVLDTLLGQGLEHHLALTYGDHFDSLLSLARMLRLPVVKL